MPFEHAQPLEVHLELEQRIEQMPHALDGPGDLLLAHDTQSALDLVVEDQAAGKSPDAGPRETIVEIRQDAHQVVGLAQDVEGHGTRRWRLRCTRGG